MCRPTPVLSRDSRAAVASSRTAHGARRRARPARPGRHDPRARTPRDYAGSLAGTPVFLGCSDIDGHIPLVRVAESTRVLGALGAQVRETIYPGMGHTVNDDEIAHVRGLMARLLQDHRA